MSPQQFQRVKELFDYGVSLRPEERDEWLEPGSEVKNRRTIFHSPLVKAIQIAREIGAGGFGAVYLAWDLQLHGRQVVLKVQLQSADWRKKFEDELRALSRPWIEVAGGESRGRVQGAASAFLLKAILPRPVKITKELGEGGFGVVYLAQDLQLHGRGGGESPTAIGGLAEEI